jgi:parallel beta-helix repeat protein
MKVLTLYCLLSIVLISFCPSSIAGNIYKWKPASGTSGKNKANWRTNCNVPGTVFPTSSDTIVFDSTCSIAACVLDTTFNVAKIQVKANYSGTITTTSGITLTFLVGLFTGGTFNGGSIPIAFNKSFKINGGAFTSTSDVLTLTIDDFIFTSGSFSHNNGTVIFKRNSSTTTPIGGTSNGASTFTMYKAEFAATSQNTQFNIRNITMQVTNELKLSGTYQLFLNTNTSSTLEVKGNLVSTNTNSTGGGTILLLINGTGSQSLTGNATEEDAGKFPSITINKASGTLSLSGIITLGGSTTWTYTAGTVSEGTAKIVCSYDNTLYNNSGGTMKFNRLGFYGRGDSHTITGKVTVTDTLFTSLSGICDINGDTLIAQGNIQWGNSSGSSSVDAVLKFTGTNAQTIYGVSNLPLSTVWIAKTSGDIILNKTIEISMNVKFVTGYLVSTSTNLVTIKNGATVSSASDNSFVNGPMKKIGNSSFIFPLGKNGNYQPLEISAASSSSDAFTCEYFNSIQSHGFETDSLTYLSWCEYWNLERTTGSSNVKVKLHWNSSSCDIYTLATLRVARWDGSKWNNLGSVTTTGNTTAGTVQTNSNLSAFGDFIISKRSPAVVANAGTDAYINLGSTATLGGSPAATGGISPYSYKWTTAYALSSDTIANPISKPFSTYTYYLMVTDVDKSIDLDTVIVNETGFDLKTAKRFPILTNDTLNVTSPVSVVGAVGARQHINGTVTATDSVLINTSSSNLAVRHLDTAMQKIDALSASSLSTTLNGQSVSGGVYRVTGNATLNGTLTLSGDYSTYIVLDINGDLSIADNSSIVLDGIDWSQVYFHANNVTISGDATLNGIFLLDGHFIGDISAGDTWVMSKGNINGQFIDPSSFIGMTVAASDARSIENYFGYNASNVIQDYGYGSPLWQTNINNNQLKSLKPDLLRYPGGSDANWWRWQTGWFRGYNNPIYNDDLSASNVKYGDQVPLPSYCTDGLPWDLNSKKYQPNQYIDFLPMVKAGSCYPLFDFNMLSSDIGTEIGGLFAAQCGGLPVKYIELGNEMYLSNAEKDAVATLGGDYANASNIMAGFIKGYFPDVKICINAAISKNNDPTIKQNHWNGNADGLGSWLAINTPVFDALSFHVYEDLQLGAGFTNCDLDSYQADPNQFNDLMGDILSTPYLVFQDLQNTTSPQPEFSLLNTYSLEGWLTEFNQEDDNYNLRGRWAHGLYTSLMALMFLENTQITKATCFDLYDDSDRDIVFRTNQGFSWDKSNCDATNTTSTNQWQKGAVGEALKYIGMATKNAYTAKKIEFNTIFNLPQIQDLNNANHDGIYGWVFSNHTYSGPSTPYSAQDSNWAVILNLTPGFMHLLTYEMFPLGGQYFYSYVDETNGGPLKYITGAVSSGYSMDLTEVHNHILSTAPNASIPLQPYSITFIRSGNQTMMGTPHIELTNSSTCIGNDIDMYVSCTGATGYIISGGTSTLETNHPTTKASLHCSGLTNPFHVLGTGIGFSPTQTIVIPASAVPSLNATVSGTPKCPNNAVTLDANGGSLTYNWYPAPNYGTLYSDESFNVSPSSDITYTVNATDGTCYCASDDIFVDMYDVADAGPDIYICTDPGKPVILGGAASYPGATLVVWTKVGTGEPDLNSYFSAQAEVNTTALSAGDYEYSLHVVYPSLACQYIDHVVLHVVDCCDATSGNSVVFDPYQSNYLNTNYLTASFLWSEFQTNNSGNTGQYDNNCGGVLADNVDAIHDFAYDLVINGLFYVDQDIAFVNCTNITMGPKAKIIIEPNYRLLIKSSTLTACGTEMWQGIDMIGNLSSVAGIEITNDCNNDPASDIEDAETAVFTSKDSKLTITDAIFNNNYNHVWIEDYRFAFNNKIKATVFEKDASMLSPHASDNTQYGIYMTDVPGNGVIINNDFSNSEFGIHADLCALTTSGNTTDHVNTGIYTVNAVGAQSITDNDPMNYCDNGIWVAATNNFSTTISGNTISTNPIGTTINATGIRVEDNGVLTNVVVGDNNPNIINSNAKYGIYINSARSVDVVGNTINIDQGSTSENMYGIYATNANKSLIEGNTIDADQGSPNRANKWGILLSYCPHTDVRCNSTNETERAIEFVADCNTSLFRGNILNAHDDGLVLGEDFPDYYPPGIFGDQTVNSCSQTPGNLYQGDGSGNFGGTGHGATRCIGSLGVGYQFFVNNNSGSDYYYPSVNQPLIATSTESAFSPSVQSNTPYDCTNCINPLLPFNSDYHFSVAFALKVIQEESPFFTDYPAIEWSLKKSMYESLNNQDSILRDSDDVINNFCDTISDNNIGKFYEVEEIIDLLTDTMISSVVLDDQRLDALDKNERITPNNTIEQNLQDVNEIYLSAIAAGIMGFNSTDLEKLFNVAEQCPYEGGYSVFTARALLSLVVDTFFDDELLCAYGGAKSGNNNDTTQATFVIVYPNPSSGQLNIQYKFINENDHYFKLYNLLGKELFSVLLLKSGEHLRIRIDDFPSGIFQFRVTDKQSEIGAGKIVLIK